MNIESAQYVKDQFSNKSAVEIIYLDSEGVSQACCVPVDGVTWQNQALNAWVDGGGTIAAAQP